MKKSYLHLILATTFSLFQASTAFAGCNCSGSMHCMYLNCLAQWVDDQGKKHPHDCTFEFLHDGNTNQKAVDYNKTAEACMDTDSLTGNPPITAWVYKDTTDVLTCPSNVASHSTITVTNSGSTYAISCPTS